MVVSLKLLSNTTADALENTRFPYIVTFVDQRLPEVSLWLASSFSFFCCVLWTSITTVQLLRTQLVRRRCQRFLLNRMKCYQAINQTAVAQRWIQFQIRTVLCVTCNYEMSLPLASPILFMSEGVSLLPRSWKLVVDAYVWLVVLSMQRHRKNVDALRELDVYIVVESCWVPVNHHGFMTLPPLLILWLLYKLLNGICISQQQFSSLQPEIQYSSVSVSDEIQGLIESNKITYVKELDNLTGSPDGIHAISNTVLKGFLLPSSFLLL